MLLQQVTWEDEETNRQIEFSIQYGLENSDVRIQSVTPTKVSFICPQTNACTRSLGVHTSAGRRVLADRLRRAGRMDAIRSELEARHFRPVVV